MKDYLTLPTIEDFFMISILKDRADNIAMVDFLPKSRELRKQMSNCHAKKQKLAY